MEGQSEASHRHTCHWGGQRRGTGRCNIRFVKYLVVLECIVADFPLIPGVNTRRPYDEDYHDWIEVMQINLGALFTSVLGQEADIRRAGQLAQLDAAKTAFFSNASHELRTPLTLIGGPIQEALNGATGRVKELLTLASRNLARLSRLVDSLLDFSKVRHLVDK